MLLDTLLVLVLDWLKVSIVTQVVVCLQPLMIPYRLKIIKYIFLQILSSFYLFKTYGFFYLDLNKKIFIDGSLGLEKATLNEIIDILKDTYASSIGVEFLHIQSPEQKQWVQERIEEVHNKTNFTNEGKKGIFQEH